MKVVGFKASGFSGATITNESGAMQWLVLSHNCLNTDRMAPANGRSFRQLIIRNYSS